MAIAEKTGVDREKFCRFAALFSRISADRKIISILERLERDLPMSGVHDPETRLLISEMILKNKTTEVQIEVLRSEIRQAFLRKGFSPSVW